MNIRQRIYRGANVSSSPLVTVKTPKGAKADMLHSIKVRRAESRHADTRFGDRYRIVGESARVSHDGSTHDAQLLNICGSGAMIAAGFEPMPWDRLKLHLGDDRPIDCKVLWIKDGRIGLEFVSEIRLDLTDNAQAGRVRDVITRSFPAAKFEAPVVPQDEPDEIVEDDNRAEHRNAVIRGGTLHYDYQSTPARLRDISSAGVMIETEASLAPGAEPLIDLGDAGSVFGTVVWAADGRAGLRFKQPFDWSELMKPRAEGEASHWEAPAYLRSNAHCDSRWEENWKNMTMNDLNEDLDGFLKR
jgi:hypothetical protein